MSSEIKRFRLARCGVIEDDKGGLCEYKDHISEIGKKDKEIRELKDQYRWRKVEDELPEHDQECLISFDEDDYIEIAIGHYQAQSTGNSGFHTEMAFVHHASHWMPLPALPQEGGEG